MKKKTVSTTAPTTALMMGLSTGSSDSECDGAEYDSVRDHQPLPRDYPIYSILGQPQLVYYAKVPRNQNEGNGGTPEKRPNCFSKAFTWYTKERGQKFICGRSKNSENRSETPDQVVGFASWLDSKYAEFLRDNGGEPDYYNTKMTKTKTAQYTVPLLNDCYKPKRLNRSKSSKCTVRHTAGNSSEAGGSVRESFEFILQPKERECFANQCTCYHKSNTTNETKTDEECQTERELTDAPSVNSLDVNKLTFDKSCQTEIQMTCATEPMICPCSELEPQHTTFIQDPETIALAHGECQTRVFPVNLDAVREYPLFMKILYADKLSRARVV